MTSTFIWVVAILVLAAIIIAFFAWVYQKATREVSLVRTGVGGRKVIMDGGGIALPYFHEISRVNMQTLRLDVHRDGEDALITRDRLRVDVRVEFYVSVMSDPENIARAAQTLGRRTFNPDQLLDLIEGKLVEAMHTVAARMTMDELHENRGAFVAEISQALTGTLERNGLELESVSLSALDQTPFAKLDENNAFNAVGMRKLAEVIADSKKERAEIDSDADVSVRRSAMEAAKRKLEIDLEAREAEIAQAREIEKLKAAQLAEVARDKAAAEQEAAQARIRMEQEIRTADIAKEKLLNEAEISRDRDLEIADKDRQIALAGKAQEESKAQAETDAVRAEAVKSAEAITTARQMADTERRLEIAAATAKQQAETEGQKQRIAAKALRDAAEDRATASEAEARARKIAKLAEAEANEALHAAENTQSAQVLESKIELARLEALPKVVSELVKPTEKIDSIRINQFSGLGGNTPMGGSGESDRPAVSQTMDSILNLAMQYPILKTIGDTVGAHLGADLADTAASDRKPSRSGGKGKTK